VTAPHRPCGRRLVDPEWNALERLQVRACRVSRQATVVDQKHSRSLWLVGNCLARLTSPRLPSDLWRACWSIENSGETSPSSSMTRMRLRPRDIENPGFGYLASRCW